MDLLTALSKELRDVDLTSTVERVHISELSPLRFATEYVAHNKPVVITGAISAWPALRSWSEEYLTAEAGDRLVTVDLTPNGRGDAVTLVVQHADTCGAVCQAVVEQPPSTQLRTATHTRCRVEVDQGSTEPGVEGSTEPGVEGNTVPGSSKLHTSSWFITPCEVQMTVSSFFQLLRSSRDTHGTHRIVPYVQHQNSSLSEEWQFLTDDIQPAMDWADQVFGAAPDATNLWIGDERSVTSFHKDHYENMYAVIRGTKVFHLLPPCDVWRMNLRNYPAAAYQLLSPPTQPVQSDVSHTGTAAHQHPATRCTSRQHELRCTLSGAGESTAIVLGASSLTAQLKQPQTCVLWSDVELPLSSTAQHQVSGNQVQPHACFGPDMPAPLVAEVGPGEVLYLPACWYHQVSQVCSEAAAGHDYVMAVNFWYDMAFDHKWAYFRYVEAQAIRLGLADAPVLMNGSHDDDQSDDDGDV